METPDEGAPVQLASKHDFGQKLRQPSVLPWILRYIEWQREVRAALANGEALPEMPEDLTPISLNLDLTTACNYRCPHCVDLEILNQKIRFDYEKLLASLDHLIGRGLRSVILIGGGEPTVHPKFGETVRFLKARGVQVAIVSNGARNEVIYDIADCLTERDWVRLSLDSARTDTFLKMHKPVKPITLEEICAWVPKIRERNPVVPIGFSFIIVWIGANQPFSGTITPNIEEIVEAAKLARDHRFTYIAYKPFLTRRAEGTEVMSAEAIADFERTLAEIRGAVDEAKTYETDDFRVLESTNLRVLMQGTWRDFTAQPAMCHFQALRHVLSPLGLYNCPAYRGVMKARIADMHAFENAERTKETQKSIAAILNRFDASHECAEITCLYNPANWWIEKAIRGELDPAELLELEERYDYFL